MATRTPSETSDAKGGQSTRQPAIEPPPTSAMRAMLMKKRDDGPGIGKALVFAINASSPGVSIPEPFRSSGRRAHSFILDRKFADLDVGEECCSVKLLFKGEWKEIIAPYGAMVDFFEVAKVQRTPKDAAYSSTEIPIEPQAIRRALALKQEVGPSDTIAIQVRFRVDHATFDPDGGLQGHYDMVIDHNYWDLVVENDRFAVTILEGLSRVRVTVPYISIEEIYGFSFFGATGLIRLGREITTVKKDELTENDSRASSKKLARLFAGYKSSLAFAAILTAVVWTTLAVLFIFIAAREYHVAQERIVFFAYLSPTLLEAIKAGHVPLSVLLSDTPLLGGLAALWAGIMAITGISLILPMHDNRPMQMQAGITGFFYAYVLTLLLYGGLTISYRYVPGLLRLSWVALLYALGERLKRAYPPNRFGAEYLPQALDGLFAIAASLIIAQGIDRTYDEALSGPAFVFIYFAVMTLFGRRMVRARLLRQLSRELSTASEIELPSPDVPRPRAALTVASGAYAQLRRNRERLLLLSFDELLAEYRRCFHDPLQRTNFDGRLRDSKIGVIAGASALLLFWGIAVLIALWGATNMNLYVLGVGR